MILHIFGGHKKMMSLNQNCSTFTITFGDQAENHAGMQMIGNRVNPGEGFNLEDMEGMKQQCELLGATCEWYDLVELGGINQELEPAYVLVIRNGCAAFGINPDDMFLEQALINHDKQAFMYGRVVQKKARWNVCFGDEPQEPNYKEKKGRIVAWRDVPLVAKLKTMLPDMLGPKAGDLYGEGNYYYDINKCGIGFHGDSERRKVVALRLGASMPIHYQWFQHSEPEGRRIIMPLHHGDIYVMSEKAVGTDWKRKNVYTLRHAAGCPAFTKTD